MTDNNTWYRHSQWKKRVICYIRFLFIRNILSWIKTKEAAAGQALLEQGRLTVCTVIVSDLQKIHMGTCGPSARGGGGTTEQVLLLETVIMCPLLSLGRGRSATPQGHVPDSEFFSPGFPLFGIHPSLWNSYSRQVPVCGPRCDPSQLKILKAEGAL